MTDARLAPTFLANAKVDGLTDAAFRVYVNSIVLGASQETDGHMARRALRLLHPEADLRACADELVNAQLWEPRADGDGWNVHDFLKYQTTKAQAEAARKAARERKARSRANQSRRDESQGHVVTEQPVTTSDKGQDRTATGQAIEDQQEKSNLWDDVDGPPICAGCGNGMPRDLAERENWTHHPTCDPESTNSTRGTAA